jgi:hypothetical protein
VSVCVCVCEGPFVSLLLRLSSGNDNHLLISVFRELLMIKLCEDLPHVIR